MRRSARRPMQFPIPTLLMLPPLLLLVASCSELGAWDLIADAEARLEIMQRPAKRIEIDLDGLAQPTELTDFPVLVRVSESIGGFQYADCSPDGLDVVFKDADGTPLPHELELWNPGGDSIFWVRAPAIPTTSASIWMYWDTEFPLDSSRPAEVWSNGYVAVFHGISELDPATGKTRWIDSTGKNAAHSESPYKAPVTIAEGWIGKAIRFDDTIPQAGIVIPDSSTMRDLGPLSFETWIRETRTADDPDRIIFSKDAMSLSVQAAQIARFSVAHETTDLAVTSAQLWFFDPTWVRIGFAWDGSGTTPDASFFRNENPSPQADILVATGTRESDAGIDFVIGNNYAVPLGSGLNLYADLDEIRISNVARTDDWMRAQYHSQTGAIGFVGTAEPVSYD